MTVIPSSSTPVHIEAMRFRSAVSEAAMQGLGGKINYLLSAIPPLGSMQYSILSEADFQEQAGEGWVLCAGQSISGSALELLTGYTTAPDARGVYLRMKNYDRDTSTGNANGDSDIGDYEGDRVGIHSHGVTSIGHSHGLPNKGIAKDNDFTGYMHTADPAAAGPSGSFTQSTSSIGLTVNNSAGPESSPRSLIVNLFIRIN